MSRLFELSDDAFRSLLSWLNIGCICSLDTAVGNVDERLMWLHSLHSIDSKAIDDYEHCHLSIQWLVTRGARATSIRIRQSNHQITDMTFAGVGILLPKNVNLVNQRFLSWLGMKCDNSSGLDKTSCIRKQGLSRVTSIDLADCNEMSDRGVSAIAKGCRLLTSINLTECD